MNYAEWEQSVPEEIKADSLWKMEAYRLALFLSDIGWWDVTKLLSDARTINVANQLYEALGSIAANLAEGYCRGTGKDSARFYEYALGSARESREWYYRGRYILGGTVFLHRLQYLTGIIRLLLIMIPQQRGRSLREGQDSFYLEDQALEPETLHKEIPFSALLDAIPLPIV